MVALPSSACSPADLAALLATVAVGVATLAAVATWAAVCGVRRAAASGGEARGEARGPRAALPPLPPTPTPAAPAPVPTDGRVTITAAAASPAPGKGAIIARPCSACASPPPASVDPTDTRPRTG